MPAPPVVLVLVLAGCLEAEGLATAEGSAAAEGLVAAARTLGVLVMPGGEGGVDGEGGVTLPRGEGGEGVGEGTPEPDDCWPNKGGWPEADTPRCALPRRRCCPPEEVM